MSQTIATLGVRKAAIVLIQLGSERAAAVLSQLSESEVEAVTAEIARLDSIGAGENAEVLGEFRDMMTARTHIAQGGLAFARQLLEQSLGQRPGLRDHRPAQRRRGADAVPVPARASTPRSCARSSPTSTRR